MPSDHVSAKHETVNRFGARIRARRKSLGMSLRQLGEKIDLTASFLAQVERGEANPSIPSLQQIANALDVPIFYFFAGRKEKRRVVHAGSRSKLSFPDSNVTYELLLPSLDHKNMGLVIRIGPGEKIEPIPLSEPTEEWLLLIKGGVEVGVAGESYTLKSGDSIWYAGWELQGVSCISDTEAVLVCSMTPPAF